MDVTPVFSDCMSTAGTRPSSTVVLACVVLFETDPDGGGNPADGGRGANRGAGEPR